MLRNMHEHINAALFGAWVELHRSLDFVDNIGVQTVFKVPNSSVPVGTVASCTVRALDYLRNVCFDGFEAVQESNIRLLEHGLAMK